MSVETQFDGEIIVASRIIDYLSSGLYESPAACLKELVNNSYDADAGNVHVLVKPDADRIIIEDDGVGMNRAEFEGHFRRVSDSRKRDDADVTASGRPIIGKIGIGFVAANEICDVMEIYSTKEGSRELLHVSIDFAQMREDPSDRRRGEDGEDYVKGDYSGEILNGDPKSHYTHVFLKKVRGDAREILAGAERSHLGNPASLYGRSPESIAELLSEGIRSWSDFDTYSETLLKVALNVPVRYTRHWMPTRLRRSIRGIEKQVDDLDFNLTYDGAEVRKPIVFRASDGEALSRRFSYEGERVAAEGYFFVNHGSIRPQNLNGLLLRIRNAAVGDYDPSFWDYPSSRAPLFQRWISAEVYADDRLEDAMNIDRSTLRVAHPAYVELRTAIHDFLQDVISDARRDLHGAGAETRAQNRATAEFEAIREVTRQISEELGDNTGNRVLKEWRSVKGRPTGRKSLLKRFTVSRIYQIVLEVAEETLEPQKARAFLRELTRRLVGGR